MVSTFEESCDRYRRFLSDNGYSGNLIWVTPQDILFTNRKLLYVKLPVPDSNLMQAREIYAAAMKAQSGISFSTVCELGKATCCSVWVPADEEERRRAMCPRDLKLSACVDSSRLPGKAVRSRLLWWYLRIRHKGRQVGGDFLWWG